MYEMPVSGEIKTLGVKEGSSGIFTGTIEGLYQGYRFGSTTPDVQHHVLEVNNGTLALVLKQEIRSMLSPRAAEHPFAGGKDPFENMPATPPGMPGGPPPGVAGGPPAGMAAGGPPPGVAGAGLLWKKVSEPLAVKSMVRPTVCMPLAATKRKFEVSGALTSRLFVYSKVKTLPLAISSRSFFFSSV